MQGRNHLYAPAQNKSMVSKVNKQERPNEPCTMALSSIYETWQ